MYPFGSRERGVSRRTRDILIILLCLFVLLNVAQYVFYRATGTRDADLRTALVTRVRADLDAARTTAMQFSRIGGSTTQRLLAETRQYLYGVKQLNELTSLIFGGGQMLVPQATVDAAIKLIETCESRAASGQTIDTPMSELWQTLGTLQEAASLL